MAKVNLRSLGTSLLSANKTFAAAVKALAEQLTTDAELRTALAADYLKRLPRKREAKPPQSRRRQGRHRLPQARRTMPTKAQKAGALKAQKTFVQTIFERKARGGHRVGDIRINEFQAQAMSSGQAMVSFWERGYEDCVDFFAFNMLSRYSVAADPFAKMRDAYKLSVVEAIFDRAKIASAKTMRDAGAKQLETLMAAANALELPAP